MHQCRAFTTAPASGRCVVRGGEQEQSRNLSAKPLCLLLGQPHPGVEARREECHAAPAGRHQRYARREEKLVSLIAGLGAAVRSQISPVRTAVP
jgi:hypothetical protein